MTDERIDAPNNHHVVMISIFAFMLGAFIMGVTYQIINGLPKCYRIFC